MLKQFHKSEPVLMPLEVAIKYIALLQNTLIAPPTPDLRTFDSSPLIPLDPNGLIVSADDGPPDPGPESPFMTWADVEREYIMRILKECDGNRDRAATILGISPRRLNRKLREYERPGRRE